MPPEEDCPYTVRINSEVMASDGSTSMASVCAGWPSRLYILFGIYLFKSLENSIIHYFLQVVWP